jgi:protein-tyrosine phosphatase
MEAMARRLVAGKGITVASAGFLPGGEPMPKRGIAVASQLGLGLDGHRSTEIRPAEVHLNDLVLTAARSHALRLVADEPELWPRVFTLKQFAEWGQARRWDRSQSLRDWVEAQASDRSKSALLGESKADDLADPVTSSSRVWRSVAAEIDAALRRGLGSILA